MTDLNFNKDDGTQITGTSLPDWVLRSFVYTKSFCVASPYSSVLTAS